MTSSYQPQSVAQYFNEFGSGEWERLVRSGAFDEVDRFSRSFTTKKAERADAQGDDKVYSFPEYDLTVKNLAATRMNMDVSFGITMKKADLLGKDEWLYFEARAGESKIQPAGYGAGKPDETEDGAYRFGGTYDMKPLDAMPDEITFVPYIQKMTPTAPGQNPITENRYLEDNAFTVKLGPQRAFNLGRVILTIGYAGVMAVAISRLPQPDSLLLLVAQGVALGLFWYASARVDPSQKASIARFYMFLWGLFYAQYVILSVYQITRGVV